MDMRLFVKRFLPVASISGMYNFNCILGLRPLATNRLIPAVIEAMLKYRSINKKEQKRIDSVINLIAITCDIYRGRI